MHEPHLRAADSDRTAVATTLGRAMSEGRLTVAEYDGRLSRAYAARTFGELAELTADLPRTPRPPSAHSAQVAHPARAATPACADDSAWRSWLTTALIVLGVWGATSFVADGPLYFWPMWVIGPWGAFLLVGTLTRPRGGPSGKAG
ncbi:DUF1707 SHOCT-like domain-containing protein [Blastococcus atacamensis]|uniref:DUF1707 SHOCT-like domain-containing protein n=1 Tax=Blastococcus atacamensis TaxID=2070508 RepID=UPI000CEB9DB4|nr:DUF1707 domain-containing protein [Blastococcus atacamensis]